MLEIHSHTEKPITPPSEAWLVAYQVGQGGGHPQHLNRQARHRGCDRPRRRAHPRLQPSGGTRLERRDKLASGLR
jgi:hypothetical protein